jgi:hypothetical protein
MLKNHAIMRVGRLGGEVGVTREVVRPIEISTLSPAELLAVAEEVQRSGKPRVLKHDDEPVAMVAPLPAKMLHRPRRRLSDADREAFLAAAGSWKGLIDGEQLKRDIKEARGSDRPAHTL